MSTNEGNVTRVTVELIITGAYKGDSGIYECSVSNLPNMVTSIVNLTVQCKCFTHTSLVGWRSTKKWPFCETFHIDILFMTFFDILSMKISPQTIFIAICELKFIFFIITMSSRHYFTLLKMIANQRCWSKVNYEFIFK